LRDREAESRALGLRFSRTDLAELLEYGVLILGRDAHAGVGDRDLGIGIASAGPNFDLPALRRELQRVGQQVQQYLLDLSLVGDDRAQIAIERDAQRDAA